MEMQLLQALHRIEDTIGDAVEETLSERLQKRSARRGAAGIFLGLIVSSLALLGVQAAQDAAQSVRLAAMQRDLAATHERLTLALDKFMATSDQLDATTAAYRNLLSSQTQGSRNVSDRQELGQPGLPDDTANASAGITPASDRHI